MDCTKADTLRAAIEEKKLFFYYTQMEIKLLKTVEFGYSASHHRT